MAPGNQDCLANPMTRSESINLAVLVVEDEPRLRELLTRAISSWGFAASGVRSAEEAIKLLQNQPHGIVLLDLNLPGEMDGLACLQVIRQRWPSMQAIILTGFGDLAAAQTAIHLDVVEFLTKPCHLGELEVALDRARRRLEAERKLPQLELPAEPPIPTGERPATLEELERQHILAALHRHDGNRAATAAELGISLRTLYYRLTEYQRQGYLKDEG